MKDGLGPSSVERLARNLALVHSGFAVRAFVRDACRGLEALELKARVSHVAEAMVAHLPDDFPTVAAGFAQSVAKWDRGAANDPLRGFAAWPVFVFVERAGGQHFTISMNALRDLTHLFTAEFSVRFFVLADSPRAMKIMESWTSHPSEQVRRLASEGIRPRLPWAGRLPHFQQDPRPVLKILEKLKDDESEYVRRSVANCLADVAVDHPDLVIQTCRAWMKGASPGRRWIIKRATRNLIKSGHPGIWGLHGYAEEPKLRIERLRVMPKTVSLGEKFELQFELHSESERGQKLVVDYVVHHVKASGKSSAKVFKLGELELAAGSGVKFSKTHAFRRITTRTYYPGPHRIESQVNGERHGQVQVDLKM